MSVVAVLTEGLKQSGELLKATLADFTDADMLVHTCDGANHAAWQLGHLIHSEHDFLTRCGASMPDLSPALKSWSKNQQSASEVSQVPSKADMLAQHAKVCAATIAFTQTLDGSELETRGGKLPHFAPTVGGILMLIPMHEGLHTGQMQVIRRKLKKPILF